MHLTDQHKEFRKRLREFCNTNIKPLAQQIDQEQSIPQSVIDLLAAEGYLGVVVSKEYGGLGLDQISNGILNEEVGRVCSSTRSLLTVHSSLVCETINKWGTKWQKEEILSKLVTGEKIGAFALSEPNIGSDVKNIETEYEIEDDCFVLNGVKKWISFAQIADYIVVVAHDKNDQKSISTFIVDSKSEGVEIIPINGLLGARGSKLAQIRLTNCKAEKSNLLGKLGFGLFQIVNTALDNGRFSVACGCLGIALGSLEESHNYAKKRKQFDSLLINHQLIRQKISVMVVGIRAARLLCYQTGWLRENKDPSSINHVNISKYFTSKLASESAKEAVQIQGALGCMESSPVQRFYRDAKIMEIIEGSNEIQELLIANFADEELI